MVDTGERGPSTAELITLHELDALGFIDSAEAAFTHADIFANRQRVIGIHDEYFESSGLTPSQLATVTTMGHRMTVNAQAFQADDGQRPPFRFRISASDMALVDTYQGIDYDRISSLTLAERYRQAFIEPEPLPEDMLSLDARIEEAGRVAELVPLPGDLHTIIGLGTLRLAKFLQADAVQAKVQEHAAFSERFKRNNTLYQAMQLVAQHLVDSRNFSISSVLRDVLHGKSRPTPEQQTAISAAISDIMFTSRLYDQYVSHMEEVFGQFGAFVGHGLAQAARYSDALIALQPGVTELTDDEAANDVLLEQEGAIADATRRIERRGRAVRKNARSIDEAMAASIDDRGDEVEISVADTPIRRTVQERLAADRSGEYATAQARQRMSVEQAVAEFSEIRSRYIASRSQIRRHADGSRIASMLATARDGSELLDMQPVSKELAFDTAGLAVRLDQLMREQQNIDVFGSLFEAVKREDRLRLETGARTPQLTLTEPVAWLLENANRLRRSSVETFRRIGDGLAAYRLAQNASPDRTKRPVRNVTVDTLHRIEAIRDSAEQLELEAFPPGPVNIGQLDEDVRTAMASSGGMPPTLDEERLLVLADLSEYYFTNGYTEMKVYRLRPGSWRHKIPYYALVIALADRKIVICENPQTPSSTIVLEEYNGEIGGAVTWEEMVQLEKGAVNEFGGRKMYHKHGSTLDEHTRRIQGEVSPRLITSPDERRRR